MTAQQSSSFSPSSSSPSSAEKPATTTTTMARTAAAALRVAAPTVSELTLTCSDGIQLAAQVWKTQQSNNEQQQEQEEQRRRRILCLHGWMDNCRSFHKFAPNLLTQLNDSANINTELVALDFPGHGLSSHKSIDGPPMVLAEAAFYVAEAVQQLQWEPTSATAPFVLVGHSMGAAVSCLYAASFPEQIAQLVLLEGVGPLARNPRDVAKHVRQHVRRRQMALQQQQQQNSNNNRKAPRIYPSLEKAIETRCQTARNFPGDQTLSREAAREMVLRGTQPAAGGIVNGGGDSNAAAVGPQQQHPQRQGIQFRHDPRLQWPSLQYFTAEQTEALYDDIQCPTALLLAQNGWPFDRERHQRTLQLLQPVVHQTLPGSHHFHADPDTADAVVHAVAEFLQRPS